MKYVYIIEKAADATYSAYVPDLPGCVSSADTIEDLHNSIVGAVGFHVAILRERGEDVPEPTSTAGMVEAA